jgi:hypothetical protein
MKNSNNVYNKRALDIVLAYNPLKPNDTSKEDFEYAKQEGLMFDKIKLNHDEAVKLAFEAFEQCKKAHITNLFLFSLSSYRLECRIGLSVFAIMHSFPKHTFEPASPQLLKQCRVCAATPTEDVNLSFANRIRFNSGGSGGSKVYEYHFYLQKHLELPNLLPNEDDFDIFKAILELVINAPVDEKPNTLQKKVAKIKGFKSNEEQRRALLEALGYCSILETDEHKGFLSQYTNLGLAPRKSHRSDWRYPFDWWEGKDGINKEAFKYWFGSYEELKEFF